MGTDIGTDRHGGRHRDMHGDRQIDIGTDMGTNTDRNTHTHPRHTQALCVCSSSLAVTVGRSGSCTVAVWAGRDHIQWPSGQVGIM